MTQALSSPTALHLDQCLDGLIDVVGRLRCVFHVKVIQGHVPANLVTDWDPTTRTVRVRDDATLEDQVWALRQLWNLLAIGPWAVDNARLQPALRLVVPQQRDGY